MKKKIFRFKLRKVQEEQSDCNENANQKNLNGFKCFNKEFTDVEFFPGVVFLWVSLPLPSVTLLFLWF